MKPILKTPITNVKKGHVAGVPQVLHVISNNNNEHLTIYYKKMT
jgi:hypothetical protein